MMTQIQMHALKGLPYVSIYIKLTFNLFHEPNNGYVVVSTYVNELNLFILYKVSSKLIYVLTIGTLSINLLKHYQ